MPLAWLAFGWPANFEFLYWLTKASPMMLVLVWVRLWRKVLEEQKTARCRWLGLPLVGLLILNLSTLYWLIKALLMLVLVQVWLRFWRKKNKNPGERERERKRERQWEKSDKKRKRERGCEKRVIKRERERKVLKVAVIQSWSKMSHTDEVIRLDVELRNGNKIIV